MPVRHAAVGSRAISFSLLAASGRFGLNFYVYRLGTRGFELPGAQSGAASSVEGAIINLEKRTIISSSAMCDFSKGKLPQAEAVIVHALERDGGIDTRAHGPMPAPA